MSHTEMTRTTTRTTPLPTIELMLLPPPPPPPEGVPRPRPWRPSSPATFCWSFLKISSRSGGPSLFFFPHWGSFGGIGDEFEKEETTLKSGVSRVYQAAVGRESSRADSASALRRP